MKKILCLFLIVSLVTISGCASNNTNNKTIKPYWDGETFVVENGDPQKSKIKAGADSSCFILYSDLEVFEQIFKKQSDYNDCRDRLIVLAKKGKSISYYYDVENGKTYTDVSIEKVFWSSSEETNGLKNIRVIEPYYYQEDENGELELHIMAFTPPSIILNNNADYYILYLSKINDLNNKKLSALDAMYYGDGWRVEVGFLVNASTRESVSKGETINGSFYDVGVQDRLYKEVFEKYVD